MNSIRQIQALNKRELEAGVKPSGSWHRDYDSAWIYIGGLPLTLSEGDIITIFSQFGEPVHINLIRDKETGKSKGFAFLKYEDQRSTDLAVDNLSGAKILDRLLNVDHSNYKKKDGEDLGDNTMGFSTANAAKKDGEVHGARKRKGSSGDEDEDEDEDRPMLKEEIELARLIQEHDPEDPMKEFLVDEKKAEVAAALQKRKRRSHRSKGEDREHRKHRHSRRERDRDSESKDKPRSSYHDDRRSKHRDDVDQGRRRHRSRSKERTRQKPSNERSRSP